MPIAFLPSDSPLRKRVRSGGISVATGMWTSVSGAIAQGQAVESVANNLANADTVGYKKDLPAFKEYLSEVERDYQRPSLHVGPVKDEHLTPIGNSDQAHVVTTGSFTNYRQGPLKVTKAPLDVALEGPGMIEVSTPQGIRYTRAGSLAINGEGRLVTKDGFPVLQASDGTTPVDPANPADLAGRFISLSDRPGLSITPRGELYSNGDQVGRISIVDFSDRKWLAKAGGQLFVNTNPAANLVSDAAVNTQVHQGMIEGSNVNPVEEMTNLIKANRLFEADLKAMKTFGELMGKEANEIGRP